MLWWCVGAAFTRPYNEIQTVWPQVTMVTQWLSTCSSWNRWVVDMKMHRLLWTKFIIDRCKMNLDQSIKMVGQNESWTVGQLSTNARYKVFVHGRQNVLGYQWHWEAIEVTLAWLGVPKNVAKTTGYNKTDKSIQTMIQTPNVCADQT